MWQDAKSWDETSGGLKLYRGFLGSGLKTSVQIASPEDRRPVNMPLNIQKEIDDVFERLFGIRFRQRSLFTTGSLEVAKEYAGDWGQVRTIKPLSCFSFCWSRFSADLYEEFQALRVGETVTDLVLRLEYECGCLADALASGHEIMMVGPAFRADFFEENKV
ncbi:hypothetical protein [Variovorax paradoxus]|uniref:hypothetical protein n=1 Tax=Variovorax paradoxus TaxID=34073 RepID=UPI001ABC9797